MSIRIVSANLDYTRDGDRRYLNYLRSTYSPAVACLQEVERGLKKFFTRWGIDCSFEFSETATRAKLVVQFRFNKDTLPMIKVRDDG